MYSNENQCDRSALSAVCAVRRGGWCVGSPLKGCLEVECGAQQSILDCETCEAHSDVQNNVLEEGFMREIVLKCGVCGAQEAGVGSPPTGSTLTAPFG